MTLDTRPRIAVTMGDPAGIGPEIALRLLADSDTLARCVPVVFGDAAVLGRVAAELRLPPMENVLSFDAWSRRWAEVDRATVLDLAAIDAASVVPGKVNRLTGKASLRYVEAAIEAAMAGRVDGVATGPVHKRAWRAAGAPYPGHTELFASRTAAARVCMMLTSSEITCSFVTAHVGYRDVPSLLGEQRILDVIELTHDALTRLRGRPANLVVCGLNPHAGERGLFGDGEEERIIVPAIDRARGRGIRVEGPLPPDTAFVPARRRQTDGFVCMYHDQGLIPLKALAFDEAVNVTLGLPVVRTSVGHGTALDIAWWNKADITSLARAVKTAATLTAMRESLVKP